jgi:hypothetical protein
MHNLDTQTHTQPSHTHYTYHTSHTIHTSRISHIYSTYHTVHTTHTQPSHIHTFHISHNTHITHTAITPIKNVNLKKFLKKVCQYLLDLLTSRKKESFNKKFNNKRNKNCCHCLHSNNLEKVFTSYHYHHVQVNH